MDAHLKGGEPFPRSPVAEVRLDKDGVPRLIVRPDHSKPLRRVDLFYAVENRNPKNRYWRATSGQQDGGTWTASLPVLDTKQPLFAFANVVYESGVCLSSNLVTIIPDDLGAAMATDTPDDADRRILPRHRRLGHEVPGDRPDPAGPLAPTDRQWPPDGLPGVTVTQAIPILTHKVGDPKWRGPEGTSLQIRVHVRAARTVRVVMHEKEFAPGWTQYTKELRMIPEGGWQTRQDHGRRVHDR